MTTPRSGIIHFLIWSLHITCTEVLLIFNLHRNLEISIHVTLHKRWWLDKVSGIKWMGFTFHLTLPKSEISVKYISKKNVGYLHLHQSKSSGIFDCFYSFSQALPRVLLEIGNVNHSSIY